jgi:hypothetical protein
MIKTFIANINKYLQKKYIIVILFFLINFLFVAPAVIAYFHGQYLFGVANYEYLFGNGFNQYSPWFTWREFQGMPNTPSLFDIFFFWALHSLYLITQGSYFTWVIYIWLIFFMGNFFAAMYLRRLVVNIDYKFSFLLGLIYTSFIPINFESSFFSLKLAACLIPLGLVLIDEIFKVVTNFSLRKTPLFLVYYILLPLIFVDLMISDPRAVIAFMVLAFAHFIYLILPFNLRRLVMTILVFIPIGIVSFLLASPARFVHDITYSTNGEYSARIAEAVLIPPFEFIYAVLFPHPGYEWTILDRIIHGLIFIIIIVGICEIIRNIKYKKLIPYLAILIFFYTIFLIKPVAEFLTLNTAYGQLFRSWRVSQYIAPFILLTSISVIDLRLKAKNIKAIFYLTLMFYFFLSLKSVWIQSFAYAQKAAISHYQEANDFLRDQVGDFKVIWTPEMGWFPPSEGGTTGPTWLTMNDSGQGFPELLSAKPTYWHYYNSFTGPYTWLASGAWKSEIMDNLDIMNVGNILGLKYFILHKDIASYNIRATNLIEANLNKATNAEKVFDNEFISIYKNNSFINRIWGVSAENSFYCDNGLSCLSNIYKGENQPYDSIAFLTDSVISSDVRSQVKKVYTINKDNKDLENGYVMNELISNSQSKKFYLLQPSDNLALLTKVACASDTHQGLYHDYLEKNIKYKNSRSIDRNNCYFVFTESYEKFSKKINLSSGKYKVIIRYLKDPRDGLINLTIGEDSFTLSKLNSAKDVANGLYYETENLDVTEDVSNLDLTLMNLRGTNIINFIAIVPNDIYEEELNKLHQLQPINNETITTFKNNQDIQISNIKRIDPSKWEFDIDAKANSFVNFAESYNPDWELIIENNGQEKIYRPSLGYGLINSFLIDKDTSGKATLIYEAQNIYETMLTITLRNVFIIIFINTLVLVFVYLYKPDLLKFADQPHNS